MFFWKGCFIFQDKGAPYNRSAGLFQKSTNGYFDVIMDEVFYCGFNGFRQVPHQPAKQTITTLVAQSGTKFFTPTLTEKSNKVNIISIR